MELATVTPFAEATGKAMHRSDDSGRIMVRAACMQPFGAKLSPNHSYGLCFELVHKLQQCFISCRRRPPAMLRIRVADMCGPSDCMQNPLSS